MICFGRTLSPMSLQYIKMTLAAAWVLAAVVIGTITELTLPTKVALAAFGTLPPLGILLLWNDPAQSMSESIREGRR